MQDGFTQSHTQAVIGETPVVRPAAATAPIGPPVHPAAGVARTSVWHVALNVALGLIVAIGAAALTTGWLSAAASEARTSPGDDRGVLGAPRTVDACLVQAAVDYQTRWQRNCRDLGFGDTCLLPADAAGVVERRLTADRDLCLSRYDAR